MPVAELVEILQQLTASARVAVCHFGRKVLSCFQLPEITPSDLYAREYCAVRASCASVLRRRVAAPIGEYVRPHACPSLQV
jgi:hypothetical protein